MLGPSKICSALLSVFNLEVPLCVCVSQIIVLQIFQ